MAVVGPAGSILLYTTDVLHRGSAMTGEHRSRFSLLADYSARGNPWMGKMSWPGLALQPGWQELVERASVRERDLFGFPPEPVSEVIGPVHAGLEGLGQGIAFGERSHKGVDILFI